MMCTLKLICTFLMWNTRFGALKKILVFIDLHSHMQLKFKIQSWLFQCCWNLSKNFNYSSSFLNNLSCWSNVMRGTLAQSLFSPIPFSFSWSVHQIDTNMWKARFWNPEDTSSLPHKASSLEMICAPPEGEASTFVSCFFSLWRVQRFPPQKQWK